MPGKSFCSLQDVLWFDDACAYTRKNIVGAQCVNRNFQQKSAVNAAGIGDEDFAELGKGLF